jgi:dTDP-glucose 4,6-dehydratase
MTKKRVLVTGGAGFIGSHFVRHLLKTYPGYEVVNFDLLTYAGNLDNLRDVQHDPRYSFFKGDIEDKHAVTTAMAGVHYVAHLAAETHVDRSISGPGAFVRTNVSGTQVLLDTALSNGIERFLHVSTDEVYGSLPPQGVFTEETPLKPNSPYSASKAGSDLLAGAYHHTFGFPVVITRCSNNYGPFQFPEKLIPLMILNALRDRPLPVYGDGLNIRDWLHVTDHCRALDLALHHGRPGEVYNIGAQNEWQNLDLVKMILKYLSKPESLIKFVEDRPGHDRRYAIDPKKIRDELGWRPAVADFGQAIRETVDWYRGNPIWVQRIESGEYQGKGL